MIKRALLLRQPDKAVERILSGKQRYIFKRSVPRQPFSRIEVFTDPGHPLIVLELLPGELHSGTVQEIGDLFARFSGMQRNEWNALFFEAQTAAAIEITAFQPVPERLQFNAVEFWRLNQAPQNLVYVPCPTWALGVPETRLSTKPGELFPELKGA
jgi:hypothetical protein